MTDDDRGPSVDGPTAMSPTSGQLWGGHPAEPMTPDDAGGQAEEPTVAAPARPDEPASVTPLDEPTVIDFSGQAAPGTDEPTLAEPTHIAPTPADRTLAEPAPPDEPGTPGMPADDDPTLAEPTHLSHTPTDHTVIEPAPPNEPGALGGPTLAEPTHLSPTPTEHTVAEPAPPDEPGVPGDDAPTLAMASAEPTTGPTTGSWPFDQFEAPPPEEPVWQPEPPPAAVPAGRSPAYYVSLGAAVVLVVGLVALAAVVTVWRPRQEVAGDGSALLPPITGSAESPVPTSSAAPPPTGPLAELAAHPLSSSTTRMPDATCALPRFDPADGEQAAFYAAAKVCADDAWRPMLRTIELAGAVEVVTVAQPVQTQTCGEITPTSPPTECDGTVYLTPAYLRDTEQNGRYPGRYLGVFLREYARALQYRTGLDELLAKVTTGSAADLDTRVDQQATCLAGVVSGAMAGRGAIDGNITGEIRARLSTVDAPGDAQSWLDKGFQQRTPAACNAWA